MTTQTKDYTLQREKLRIGAWYAIEMGWSGYVEVCISRIGLNGVCCVFYDDSRWKNRWFPIETFFSQEHKPIFFGYGKRLWFKDGFTKPPKEL